jgi:5'-phosphate synthase pdxT subunit
MTIAILALQGGFAAHAQALTALGQTVRLVKTPDQLDGCEGLVLPGGESSTMLTLLATDPNWFSAIKIFAQDRWILGTCAGMILMADHVEPNQPSFKLLPISVARNAYGRQRESRIISLPFQTLQGNLIDAEVVFIRAPKIKTIFSDVQVLLLENETPLLVQHRALMAASFHPECAKDLSLYKDCIQRLRQRISPTIILP